MRILQYNDNDLLGRRFNGYDLNQVARKCGHFAEQFVFCKKGETDESRVLTHNTELREKLIKQEEEWSLNGLLYPYGNYLKATKEFKMADIVHYHLIHNQVLSLYDLPILTSLKPSVWTWHDPWAVTGHCVHPKQCKGWETGCSPCPHLGEYFPMKKDRAGEMWKIKKEVYQKSDIDIVVSSDFMLHYAQKSPLGRCFPRIHKIPFGITLSDFGKITRQDARKRFNIPQNHYVIAFRNESNPYKGADFVYSMLKKIQNNSSITILTLGFSAPPKNISARFHGVHLGLVNDTEIMSLFYAACDVFLMPSIAESFGLMAVEAMASSRPVVCFEGTALPAVTFAPACGIAVPKEDVEALCATVQRLQKNSGEAVFRGELGRRLAEEHYAMEDYVRCHLELYQEVIERHTGAKKSKDYL